MITPAPSLNPIHVFLHCNMCVEELGVSYDQKLTVGIDDGANLVVWCERHDALVHLFERGKIDDYLNSMVEDGVCDACGSDFKDHEKKETIH